jgi:hypothetical protein
VTATLKEVVKEAVDDEGVFITVLVLTFFLSMSGLFLAFLAWVWWPLPIILLSLIGFSRVLVAWASKGE